MTRTSGLAIATAEILEELFPTEELAKRDEVWYQDPLPLAQFAREHLGIELWPVQQQDFEEFLGKTVEDTKRLFTQTPPTPYNCGALIWGKGCLGEDEAIGDYWTGQTKTVKEWAELGCPLLVKSWNGSRVVYVPASPVYLKGQATLYKVTLSDGRSQIVTGAHRYLSPTGWVSINQIRCPCKIFTEGDRWLDIVWVERVGEGDFYDLTVPNTHCYFCAKGILSHNSGKDLIASTALVWFVHILLCLKHPQQFLGLEESEAIDIALASPTLRQTRRITFTKFKNRLKRWSWLYQQLGDRFGVDNPGRYLKLATEAADFVQLPQGIRVHNLPLNPSAAEGFNIIAFILSEFAALTSEATASTASEVYQAFSSSGATRFLKAWKGMIASFPRHYDDPQELLVKDRDQGLMPELFVVRRATWEVHPRRTFEDFKTYFDRNPEDAWAKFGARPRAAVDAYFRSPHLILEHAHGAPLQFLQERLPDRDIETLQAIAALAESPLAEVNSAGDPVLDRRGFPKLARWLRGQRSPAGVPYDYYVHLDPGLSGDSFGFALGHVHQFDDGQLQPTIDLAFRWTGAMFANFGAIFRQSWFDDTQDQTEVIKAAEVDFRTVREFIYFLQAARGFNIRQVSIDNWNSAESRQDLERRDFEVRIRVVNKEDYDILKELIYNRQLRYYGSPVFVNECYKLQLLNGTKIEAPRTREGEGGRSDSHKDVADAIAAVTRYLSFLQGDQTEFYQSPKIDELIIKKGSLELGNPEVAQQSLSNLSENQQILLDLLQT